MEGVNKRLANWMPALVLLVLMAWMLYLWHHPVHPPVGTYIAILAFVGAVVSIFPPDNKWAKAACFLVFGAFLVLEITTLYQQRSDDQQTDRDKRKEEDNRFACLLKDQQASFAGVLSQSQQQFAATMKQFGENVRTITGGNSFPIVESPLLQITPNTFPLIIQVRGHYDLYDVEVDVARLPELDLGTQKWFKEMLAGTNQNLKTAVIGNVSHKAAKIIPITITASEDGSITEYSINVFARNGVTHESFRLRKNLKSGTWESSFKVLEGNKVLEKSKPEWRGFRLGATK
jgi:hypothetical protein